MQEHILCCPGQAGFNYLFDNGKIINYQDNFNKIGDLPFSIYSDFETTTGSAVFFDAKMYVISYCIVVAFHPDLNLSHMFIYQAYDQIKSDLESMVHFSVVQKDFFNFPESYNLKTLKQLQDAVLLICNRTRETALAEMFNIELKFTCDCLRKWFERNIKLTELDEEVKHDYFQNNKPDVCCICDFSINSRAPKDWLDHICIAEHLFLENLYEAKDMYCMEILDFYVFLKKVKKVLDNVDKFCESLEKENLENINSGNNNSEIEEIVAKIQKIKTHKNDKSNDCTKKKIIGYLYRQSIPFLSNDKIDPSFSMSEKFLLNLYHIHTNKPVIHHSHITGNVIGFAHEYCNSQVRENYYNIPLIAHNQFKFDFFLFLKGLRPTVWETIDIQIGGRNATNINFAITQNQVRFIDTIKYFQQSLSNLALSMTEIEKKKFVKTLRGFYLTD